MHIQGARIACTNACMHPCQSDRQSFTCIEGINNKHCIIMIITNMIVKSISIIIISTIIITIHIIIMIILILSVITETL